MLDHGLYGKLSDDFRRRYCLFWKALVTSDEQELMNWCRYYKVPNYKQLTSILLMQQFDGIGSELADKEQTEKGKNKFAEVEMLFKKLTDEQKEKLKNLTLTMKAIPEELLFILRTSMLLRAVNRDLGAPVNRFKIMAQAAIKGVNRDKSILSQLSLYQRLSQYGEGLLLAVRLQWNSIAVWGITKLYSVARALGILSDEVIKEVGIAELEKLQSTGAVS